MTRRTKSRDQAELQDAKASNLYRCTVGDEDAEIAPAGWHVNLDALDQAVLEPHPMAYNHQNSYYPTYGQRWSSINTAVGG